jgi:hypothetical protein
MVPRFAMSALLVLLCGCFAQPQAQNAVNMMEASAIHYQRNMDRVVEGFIGDYRRESQKTVDALANQAIAAEVGLDGKANAMNLQIILAKKVEQYQAIELRVIEMRSKILEASQDIEHLLKYSVALKEYFAQRNSTASVLNESSATLISTLDQIISKKGGSK